MIKCYVKIVTNRKNYLKWSFRRTFRTEKQLDKGLTMIKKDKCITKLDNPNYIGASILELIKVLMCDFTIITSINMVTNNEPGDKAELLFTDTDSLTYEIKTGNVYEVI